VFLGVGKTKKALTIIVILKKKKPENLSRESGKVSSAGKKKSPKKCIFKVHKN
jgi:hypothetical protein